MLIQPRVFLAHPVLTRTPSGGTRWKFDIDRVRHDYGEILCVFDNSDMMLTPVVALGEIEKFLTHNRFDPDYDFFLSAGDMTAYGMMMGVAVSQWGRSPRQLRHNKLRDCYDVLPAIDWEKQEAVI